MLLLRNIEQYALDPSYHDAAQRKKAPVGAARKFVVFAAAIVLAFTGVAAAQNLRAWGSDSQRPQAQLAGQVRQAQERVQALDQGNAELAAKARAAEVLEGVSSEIPPNVALAAASTRVTCPGVLVTISTDQGAVAERPMRFRDTDLRDVKNLLWEAGAEALAINGNRMGPDTSVRLAGDSILVNLVPVTPPYVLEAIGDPATLWSALQQGEATQQIKEIGRSSGATITVTRAENLVLGALPLRTTATIQVDNEQ